MADENPFIWHELVTGDQTASGAFFCELLGWTCKQVDAGAFGVYTLFRRNGRDIAGMMNPTPDTPRTGSFWHAYIEVESVDECARRAAALGGTVAVAPHDVPDVGRICAVADPTGAVAHLMQPVSHDKGSGLPAILEAAPLQVRPGQSDAFEAAFREAQAIISSMPGYRSHELQRCLERDGHYLLLVRWDSVAAHEEGFRKSPQYQRWKQLLHHFYDPFPTVLHYERVEGATS